MTGRIVRKRDAGRPAAALGGAILLTLGGGVWTTIVRIDHGHGPDRVIVAADTTLRHAGQSRLALAGDRLEAGDVLLTGATGHATVDVPGGELALGPSTVVTVSAPDAWKLEHGTAGVARLHGKGALTLAAGTATAGVSARGSVIRVARTYAVSAAVLGGTARMAGVDGDRLDVPSFAVVDVPGVALPATTGWIPSLDHDPGSVDAVLAPELVATDAAIERLAAQVDADTAARVALRPAAYEAQIPAAASHPSEVALTRAIGLASPGDATAASRQAVTLREQGAAWGIVAAKLGVSADALRPLVDKMLALPDLRALVPPIAT
jgi:hypothetical protein